MWLLNADDATDHDNVIELFQPFICWSVAFELRLGLGLGFSRAGFNPLFVGVWLLNAEPIEIPRTTAQFQPFICWSVAFEWHRI